MAIPIIPILTAVTTLGLAAFDLFKRRSATQEDRTAQNEEKDLVRLAASLRKRMTELEESDIEQARLIAELSKNIEALAKALQSEINETKKRENRTYWTIVGLLFISVSSLGLTLWHILR